MEVRIAIKYLDGRTDTLYLDQVQNVILLSAEERGKEKDDDGIRTDIDTTVTEWLLHT
jgi:hypothetical protein